jgi:hypothetical protein
MGKCENQDRKQVESVKRIVICMGLYYGWWTWNGTPTLYFFPPVGVGLENSESEIGSEIMGYIKEI